MTVNNIAIEIDGPDKTAKDTIAKYIEQLTNYKYTLNVRGVLTQLVYNDKFNRNNIYKIAYKPLIILLSASEEDIEIRCRMTREPKYNSNKDREVYEKYAELLEEYGYGKDLKVKQVYYEKIVPNNYFTKIEGEPDAKAYYKQNAFIVDIESDSNPIKVYVDPEDGEILGAREY